VGKCYEDCDHDPLYLDSSCGDLGYGYRNLDVTTAGSRPIWLVASGAAINGNSVLAVASGWLAVSYS